MSRVFLVISATPDTSCHSEVYSKRGNSLTDLCPQEEVRQLGLPEILRERVLESLHNNMYHEGVERTLLLARTRFYWPGTHADTEKCIKSCVSIASCPRCLNLRSEHRWYAFLHHNLWKYWQLISLSLKPLAMDVKMC